MKNRRPSARRSVREGMRRTPATSNFRVADILSGTSLVMLSKRCGGGCVQTMDMNLHDVGRWDLAICHPPCTRLCNSGQRWMVWGDEAYREKKRKEQLWGVAFFMKMFLANADRIAVENPSGIMSSLFRKPDCIYNPYDFIGETETKKTCLWLVNLPPLKPTQFLPKEKRTQGIWKAHFDGKQYGWNDPEVAKLRSKTPFGVAEAMVDQWGSLEVQE